jgi:hypothetical protein
MRFVIIGHKEFLAFASGHQVQRLCLLGHTNVKVRFVVADVSVANVYTNVHCYSSTGVLVLLHDCLSEKEMHG